jgi:hypothetical protein
MVSKSRSFNKCLVEVLSSPVLHTHGSTLWCTSWSELTLTKELNLECLKNCGMMERSNLAGSLTTKVSPSSDQQAIAGSHVSIM